jgi:hypothetical protein
MNLVIGKRVEFREVMVDVRFTDGTPMQTALVRVAGELLIAGEPEWVIQAYGEKGGTFRFFAPANRRLRIDVKDGWKRDLHGVYQSQHEPGTTPILQQFVIAP